MELASKLNAFKAEFLGKVDKSAVAIIEPCSLKATTVLYHGYLCGYYTYYSSNILLLNKKNAEQHCTHSLGRKPRGIQRGL